MFLTEYVLPVGKWRNYYLFSLIKKPQQPPHPNRKVNCLIYVEVLLFLSFWFISHYGVCMWYRGFWGFILLFTYKITTSTDVKLCFGFCFHSLLNLLVVCFQIGFSYLLFFLKWYFDALFLSAVATDGLVFIGMQESWWGYWSVVCLFFFYYFSFFLSHGHLDWAICLPNSENAEDRHFLFSSLMNCTFR